MFKSFGSSFERFTGAVNVVTSNPNSEDKSETVTNFVLITYYFLVELENVVKEKSGGRSVLFME